MAPAMISPETTSALALAAGWRYPLAPHHSPSCAIVFVVPSCCISFRSSATLGIPTIPPVNDPPPRPKARLQP